MIKYQRLLKIIKDTGFEKVKDALLKTHGDPFNDIGDAASEFELIGNVSGWDLSAVEDFSDELANHIDMDTRWIRQGIQDMRKLTLEEYNQALIEYHK